MTPLARFLHRKPFRFLTAYLISSGAMGFLWVSLVGMSPHTYGFDLLGFLTFPIMPIEFAVEAISTIRLNQRFVYSDALIMLTVFAVLLVIVWCLITFLLPRRSAQSEGSSGLSND